MKRNGVGNEENEEKRREMGPEMKKMKRNEAGNEENEEK